jgi:hypothetical protein
MEELQYFDYALYDFKSALAKFEFDFAILLTSLDSLHLFVRQNVAVIEAIQTPRPPILFPHSCIVPYGIGDPNDPAATEFRIIKVIPASVDEDHDQINRFYVKEYRNARSLYYKTSCQLHTISGHLDKHYKHYQYNTNPEVDRQIDVYRRFLDIHREKTEYYTRVIKYKHRLVTHETP